MAILGVHVQESDGDTWLPDLGKPWSEGNHEGVSQPRSEPPNE